MTGPESREYAHEGEARGSNPCARSFQRETRPGRNPAQGLLSLLLLAVPPPRRFGLAAFGAFPLPA